MKLNTVEFALMNNPIRAFSQRAVETPRMFAGSESLAGKRVLEIGCGRGVGIEILLDRGAQEVSAFDIDPEMVELARKRTARRGERVQVSVGDVEAIAAPDASFDAAVEFGILHHVLNWQPAIGEIVRVLKPGGAFYFEDILVSVLDRLSARGMHDYPEMGRFSGVQFRAALETAGLCVAHWQQWGEIMVFGRAVKADIGSPRAASS
jgi:ubiquinone/menaquinone biosynthesis C-methylase UbiE